MTANHETYELLAEHARDVIWAIEPRSLRLLYVNRAVQDFLGVPAEEATQYWRQGVASTESMAIAVQELPRIIREHLRTHRSRTHFARIIEHRHRSGRSVWGESSITLIGHTANELRLIGITRDVTAETQARQRLAANEAQLRAILHGVPVIMLLLDRTHCCQELNRQAEVFLRTTRAAARGRSLCRLLRCTGPTRPSTALRPSSCLHCPLAHALCQAENDPAPRRREITLELLREGTPHLQALRVSVTPVPADREARIVLCLEDVTEQQRRTETTSQTERLELFGQLAGGIVHDLSNILAVVVLHLGLLQNQPEAGARLRNELGELEDAIRVGAALARQLLLFSRCETPSPTPVDVNAAIAHALKLLRFLLGTHIRIVSTPDNGLPFILGDPGMIEQVLINLCLNARDAMPRGGTLTLRSAVVECQASLHGHPPAPQTGRFVVISVSDTGCGIAATILPRIFDPFFTTKSPGRGTGIGLATVRAIVECHQGWVDVRSQPGVGTTFDVGLPAATGPASHR